MNWKPVGLGLLGCGPISQFAHLPALSKARGVSLLAVCDAAPDLLETFGARYSVSRKYSELEDLLADEEIEGVVIAVSDPFHVPLAKKCLQAGKHVLVEKPLGTSSRECRELVDLVDSTGLKLQVGAMKRHDPALEFAEKFIRERVGDLVSVSGYYWDSSFRPAMQESLLPPVLTSEKSRRPEQDPKADSKKYFLETHGVHLFDTLRFFGGPIASLQAQWVLKEEQHCWTGILEYESGAQGHFNLIVKVHSDWAEGYTVHGEGGSLEARVYLPFYFKSSTVQAFDRREGTWSTPLGEHSNPYKRQAEAFARAIRENRDTNPDAREGLAAVRALEAVAESVETGKRVTLD